MRSPLQLKRVSAEQMAVRNVLYQGHFFISAKWLGAQWQWLLRPSDAPVPRQIRICADWGAAKAILWADLHWLEGVTQLLLQETDVAALPADLQIALAETAFVEIAEQIEAASKKNLRITSMQIADEECVGTKESQAFDAIAWQATCEGQQFEGDLWLDAQGMKYAGAVARTLTRIRSEEQGWQSIPVNLRFVIGQTELPSAIFAALKPRDVVLMDESWLQEHETLTVVVAGNAAFRARLSGANLVVTEGLMNIMDESCDDNAFTPDEIISDLPIKLSFDLGERSVTLGELQAIAPGYTFDLGRDMRQAVIIRANGMRIGEGELVDIEGRTGVAVLSLSSRPV
jgi:type III secretion protein Q